MDLDVFDYDSVHRYRNRQRNHRPGHVWDELDDVTFLSSWARIDDAPVHGALREALANCLINADYHESRGIVIIKTKNGITIPNPGGFRIDLDEAKSGGIFDPRNTTLIKMFNLINIGERAGSGIPNIYNVWKKQGCRSRRLPRTLNPPELC